MWKWLEFNKFLCYSHFKTDIISIECQKKRQNDQTFWADQHNKRGCDSRWTSVFQKGSETQKPTFEKLQTPDYHSRGLDLNHFFGPKRRGGFQKFNLFRFSLQLNNWKFGKNVIFPFFFSLFFKKKIAPSLSNKSTTALNIFYRFWNLADR